MANVNSPSPLKTALLTAFALIAFAANSVLCRLALGEEALDAGSFTVIRLVSGMVVLLILMQIRGGRQRPTRPHWTSPAILFVYAVAFSYAYVTLDTGTGALILFGAVQTTIIVSTVMRGGWLRPLELTGVLVAFMGFLFLVLPGVSTPSVWGFVLMSLAGIAWGFYTLQGKGSTAPLADNAMNFLWTLPLVGVLVLATFRGASISMEGLILAVLSGGVASGIGYTVWYSALRGLTSTQAAVVQLQVPLLAALGGVVFSGEVVTLRFMISAALVLGGILLVVLRR